MSEPTPLCRVDVTPEQRAREADRSVLYGAIMLARRPQTRLKPSVAAAAAALAPAVTAFLAGQPGAESAAAWEYACACGAEQFLLSKRQESNAG